MFTETLSEGSERIEASVADRIDRLREHDLVVINEDERTWLVTEIVDEQFEESDDPRQRKRTVRLDAPTGEYGLVLVVVPDGYRARLVPLASDHYAEEQTEAFAVQSVRSLDTDIEFAVVDTGQRYHRPAPAAAAAGEARPLCQAQQAEDALGRAPRFVRTSSLGATKVPCRYCFRTVDTAERGPLQCPDCDTHIGSVVVAGTAPVAISEVRVACPNAACDWTGMAADSA